IAVNWFTGRIHLAVREAIVAVGLLLYSVVYISARQDAMSVTDYVMLFTCGLPALYLLFMGLQKEGRLIPLLYKFVNIFTVLSVVSIFYWLFGSNMRWIRPTSTFFINWGVTKRIYGFHGIHFQTQLDTTFMREAFIYRNSSIFAEAPMYNLWLDIVLAIELFLKKRPSKARVSLLAVTILTTMSVTGILFLALCFVLWLIQDYRKQSAFMKRMIIALTMLVMVPVLVAMVSYSLVMKSGTTSYTLRLSDYVAGLKLWWEHPIFGGGYANLRALQQYAYDPTGVLGFSNSVAAVLGTGGLWMTMIFFLPHFGMVSPRVAGSRRLACFGICYLFLFCTTAYFGRFLSVVIIAFEMVLILCPQREDT
ncbi:MAG: O-antigen ligase family protein, partial [Oscillospiraceae bacterium]|nr:O-antigen ligase family protein [Oscillospiraceae bacterium]